MAEETKETKKIIPESKKKHKKKHKKKYSAEQRFLQTNRLKRKEEYLNWH